MLLMALGVVSGQSLDSMLVLEMSPGTEQAIGLIHGRVFQEDDRAGVIGFASAAHVLQPLTEDRDALAAALQRAGIRAGVAVGGPDRTQLNSNATVDLAGAIRKACGEFGERGSTGRKRAIIVYFAGEDPNLSANLNTLQAVLGSVDARLYAVVVPRANTLEPTGIPRTGASPFPIPSPAITAQIMSQLTQESGGRIYRRNWDLREILAEARKP
jgi:hypothetical protein